MTTTGKVAAMLFFRQDGGIENNIA